MPLQENMSSVDIENRRLSSVSQFSACNTKHSYRGFSHEHPHPVVQVLFNENKNVVGASIFTSDTYKPLHSTYINCTGGRFSFNSILRPQILIKSGFFID